MIIFTNNPDGKFLSMIDHIKSVNIDLETLYSVNPVNF